MFFIFLLLILVVAVIAATVSVVAEYERLVVFRLGRVVGTRGPGVVFVIRGIDEVRRVSLRLVAVDLPAQEVVTIDNAPVRVRAELYVRVVDPVKAVVEVEDYRSALVHVAHASLRAAVGQVRLSQLLHDEAAVIEAMKRIIDERTRDWGVEVGAVDIKDVDLPDAVREALLGRRPSTD